MKSHAYLMRLFLSRCTGSSSVAEAITRGRATGYAWMSEKTRREEQSDRRGGNAQLGDQIADRSGGRAVMLKVRKRCCLAAGEAGVANWNIEPRQPALPVQEKRTVISYR